MPLAQISLSLSLSLYLSLSLSISLYLSPTIRLYRPSLPAGLQGNSLYEYRAVVDGFLLVAQPLPVHVKRFTGILPLWVCPYFSNSVLRVWFVSFEWFSRLVVGGRTAAVLWYVSSRICSIQLVTFLRNCRHV